MNLIVIKTGVSETFLDDQSGIVSLGDVFRTRVLLNLKFDQFVWLTSNQAIPLLKYDKDIQLDSIESIKNYSDHFSESYVLNLEKNLEIYKYYKNHQKLIGLVFDDNRWKIKTIKGEIFEMQDWRLLHGNQWAKMLIAIFKEEQYPSFYQYPYLRLPDNQGTNLFDVGLNWMVGKKWSLKSLEAKFWEDLANNLENDFKISWQKGLSDLEEYLNWINSNKLIVTNDSLGLHLAMALKKDIIVFFLNSEPNCFTWRENEMVIDVRNMVDKNERFILAKAEEKIRILLNKIN